MLPHPGLRRIIHSFMGFQVGFMQHFIAILSYFPLSLCGEIAMSFCLGDAAGWQFTLNTVPPLRLPAIIKQTLSLSSGHRCKLLHEWHITKGQQNIFHTSAKTFQIQAKAAPNAVARRSASIAAGQLRVYNNFPSVTTPMRRRSGALHCESELDFIQLAEAAHDHIGIFYDERTNRKIMTNLRPQKTLPRTNEELPNPELSAEKRRKQYSGFEFGLESEAEREEREDHSPAGRGDRRGGGGWSGLAAAAGRRRWGAARFRSGHGAAQQLPCEVLDPGEVAQRL